MSLKPWPLFAMDKPWIWKLRGAALDGAADNERKGECSVKKKKKEKKKAMKYKINKLPYDGAVFSFILVGSAKFCIMFRKNKNRKSRPVSVTCFEFPWIYQFSVDNSNISPEHCWFFGSSYLFFHIFKCAVSFPEPLFGVIEGVSAGLFLIVMLVAVTALFVCRQKVG